MTDTTSVPGTVPATTTTTAWFDGKTQDQELIGHIQNRGWDKKDAVTVALEAATAHRNAEKHIGIPADQIIRMPKLDDPAAVKSVMVRLGAPEDASKYDFSRVKKSDGTDLDASQVDLFRGIARDNFLPQVAAEKMATALIKAGSDAAVKRAAEEAANLKIEQDALDKNWGANKQANSFIAQQAASKFGSKIAAAVAALEGKAGYAAVMEMMLEFGLKTGEDKFVNRPGGGTGNNEPMTISGAKASKADLMRDQAFVARFNSGDTEARKQMAALDYIIAGVRAA